MISTTSLAVNAVLRIGQLGGAAVRIAALILGLLGAFAGFAGALFAMGIGGLGSALGGEGAEVVIGLGATAFVISFVALIGTALALAKPQGAGITMIICGIAGIIAISAGYVIAGPLLIIAGILAVLGKRELQSKKVEHAQTGTGG